MGIGEDHVGANTQAESVIKILILPEEFDILLRSQHFLAHLNIDICSFHFEWQLATVNVAM